MIGNPLPRSSAPLSSFGAALLVARKELLASFRDRQTTLYMVVLPIALYPLLFWVLIQGSLVLAGRRERTEVEVALVTAPAAQVEPGLALALREDEPGADRELVALLPAQSERSVSAGDGAGEDAARALVKSGLAPAAEPPGAGDAVLYLGGGRLGGVSGSADEGGGARLYYDSTVSRSELARERVERRLPAHVQALRRERATALGLDPSALAPLRVEEPVDVSQWRERGAYLLSFLLPMLLVVMTVLGAFYPAVDLTAGERERRTEDTTLLLPVPRLAVHQGKILAVCAAALLATALNLLAIGLSAGHLLSLARLGDGAQIELPIAPLVALAPLAALFALFVSAVLTGVASFARTFQEGQALLGPVQLAFVAPAMAGAVPGIESSIGFAFVPVLNVVLAFRGLLLGESQPLFFLLTALSLCAYAALATWIALRALSREHVPGETLLRRFLERRSRAVQPS